MLKLYLTAVCIIIAGILSGKFVYSAFAFIELFLILNASQLINVKHRKIAYAFNAFLSVILLLQQGSIVFSGDYISVMMFENIGEYNALGASVAKYAASALLMLCIALLPHKTSLKLLNRKLFWCALAIFILSSIAVKSIFAKPCPPVFSFVSTSVSYCKSRVLHSCYESMYKNASSEKIFEEFYKKEIAESNISISRTLGGKLNVIVIFTEGMSAEVIDKFNS
ncbi:MAG: hypothetical protein LBB53_02160, partial [Prevotellaceae bacterium]|nr:hypothetical protein [Prevotellaceae bacterium]